MHPIKLTHTAFWKVLKPAVIGLVLLAAVLAPVQSLLGQASIAHAGGPGSQGPVQTITPDQSFCSTADTCLSGIVYLFAVYLMSGFAYVTSYIFNFAVQLGLSSNTYAIDFISQGWTIVRDIANLSFVFILIYIAYTIIIEAETAGTMRLLAWVVAMALLINFSFFITRMVIDGGNILAVQFYNAISIKDPTTNAPAPLIPSPLGGVTQPAVKDLTAGIMNAVRIQGILGTQSFQQFSANNGFFAKVGIEIFVFVAVGLFLALMGFMFLTAGIKIIVRIIILWIAIIAAPLAFAAHAVPQNKRIMGYYAMWQKNLLESAFYPAIFLFLFFILTLFTNALAGSGGIVPDIFNAIVTAQRAQQNNAGGVFGIAGVVAIVGIRIGLVTAFLYFAMKFSDSFSEAGSGIADRVRGWISKTATNGLRWTGRQAVRGTARGAIAGTAFAGRTVVGGGANLLARTSWMQDKAAKSAIGGAALSALKGVSGASFDLRASGIPIPGLKGLGKAGGKGGFDKAQSERAKEHEKRGKAFSHDVVDVERAKPEVLRKLHSDYAEAERQWQNARTLGVATDIARYRTQMGEIQSKINDPEKLTKETESHLKELDKKRREDYAKRISDRHWSKEFFTDPLMARPMQWLFGPTQGDVLGAEKVRKLNKEKSKAEKAVESITELARESAPETHPKRTAVMKSLGSSFKAPEHGEPRTSAEKNKAITENYLRAFQSRLAAGQLPERGTPSGDDQLPQWQKTAMENMRRGANGESTTSSPASRRTNTRQTTQQFGRERTNLRPTEPGNEIAAQQPDEVVTEETGKPNESHANISEAPAVVHTEIHTTEIRNVQGGTNSSTNTIKTPPAESQSVDINGPKATKLNERLLKLTKALQENTLAQQNTANAPFSSPLTRRTQPTEHSNQPNLTVKIDPNAATKLTQGKEVVLNTKPEEPKKPEGDKGGKV